MANKRLSCIVLVAYLFSSLSCAHQIPREYINHQPEQPFSDKISWWQKEENQWIFTALLTLGIGLGTAASMVIIYNSGGLFIRVKN